MDVVKAVIAIALGLTVLWATRNEAVTLLRLRRGGVRTTAVVVGHRTAGAAAPGTRQRSAVFEFTTGTGEVIRSAGSASTPRGPRAGTRIPVVYDPADPRGTAERPGVIGVKVALLPFMLALGVFLVYVGVTALPWLAD
ncbi:DUF3592 domain-containing protein [Actinomadura welshii]